VIADGRTVTEVARDWGVSRKTLHAWLARYELAGWEGPDCRRVRALARGHAKSGRDRHLAYSGSACDVLVTDGLLQFWVGYEFLKTVARRNPGAVRKMHAGGTAPRR
jgi:Homeodomain-like domain